jgi:hypothetical protein
MVERSNYTGIPVLVFRLSETTQWSSHRILDVENGTGNFISPESSPLLYVIRAPEPMVDP